MEMSEYVAVLRKELATITRFADEDVTRAAEMLTEAMESSVRLTLLEVLSAAAAEITTRLDDAVIEVRLAGGDPDFVVTMTADEPADQPGEPSAAGEAAGSDDMARVTLRIAEPLKARVDATAAAAGVSVNTWLIRAISQALDTSGGRGSRTRKVPGVGQRFTGYARS